MNRDSQLERLRTETFDLCVIGGGASGAGSALDAVLRGMRVALIEADDFSSGASSKSTKMAHGGVRYLEQAFRRLEFGHLKQVRHGLEERTRLLQNAPHLARPLALITPVFSWWQGLYYRIGLWLYDLLAADRQQLPASRWLSRQETLEQAPALSPRVQGAVLYYDGQLDDARYCLALVQSACEAGAAVANHLRLVEFEKDAQGVIQAARAEDTLSGETIRIRARLFLNCTGPGSDAVRHLANPALPELLRPSKGAHLVLPAAVLPPDKGILIPKTRDGRMIFALPAEGRVIVGTTDAPYRPGDGEPVLESAETDFLLESLSPYLHTALTRADVRAGFGGLRPLLAGTTAKSSHQLLRDHLVEHDETSNLFSLLGGKWTTYRIMARDAVDRIGALLNIKTSCSTADYRLAGAEHDDPDAWQVLCGQYGFERDTALHLCRHYGARGGRVAALCTAMPGGAERVHPGFPHLQGEVAYAVREEMACTLRDVMARRLRLETADWEVARAAAPRVAAWMQQELHWSDSDTARRVAEYQALIHHFQAAALV